MRKATESHSCVCEFCRNSSDLKIAAQRHMTGLRSAFILATKDGDLEVLLKNCMAFATRKNNPKLVAAIGKAWADIIKAFK